jgi:hypothetical protein
MLKTSENVKNDFGLVLMMNVGYVRFQVLSAASMKMTVFWDIVACSLVEVD